MEIDPKELIAFIALVIKHDKMLIGASNVLYNHSVLLKTLLPKCYFCDKAPTTVRHRKHGMGSCERCAAEKITEKKSVEADWLDIELAAEIRGLLWYAEAFQGAEALPVVVH